MTTDQTTDALGCLLLIDGALIAILAIGVIAILFPAACRWMTGRLERLSGIKDFAE